MSSDKRLYGTPEAEHLYGDPGTVWESELEPYIEGSGKTIIEEWTVHDPVDHLPSAEQIIEYIHEWACGVGEVAEYWGDDFPFEHEVVVAHTEMLLRVIADRITFRMAKDKVAEHIIEWTGEEGENPTYDDEPMYRPTKEEQ